MKTAKVGKEKSFFLQPKNLTVDWFRAQRYIKDINYQIFFHD